METLEEEDPELADEIRKRMFMFGDIVKSSMIGQFSRLSEKWIPGIGLWR